MRFALGPMTPGLMVNLSALLRYHVGGLLGAIVAAPSPLARRAVLSPFTAIVRLTSAGILWRFKVDTVWLLLAAGAVGWLWRLRG